MPTTTFTVSEETKPQPAETQAQYISRMRALKKASAGTGIKTMLPPSLPKPEIEELEQRS